MADQIIAVRPLTNQIVAHDLGVTNYNTSRELNGPGGVFGSISPAVAFQRANDGFPIVEPYMTALFVTDGTRIKGGGLVTSISNSGPERTFNAPGYFSILNGQPFLDTRGPADFERPELPLRAMLNHLQAQPRGNLRLTLELPSNHYLVIGSGGAPYTLMKTNYTDVGAEMARLLEACSMDWVEEHAATLNATTGLHELTHTIRASFPRMGTVRTDQLFHEDENIVALSEVTYGGDNYSADVIVRGAGEGYAAEDAGMVRRATRNDGRVRRAVVVTDGTLVTPAQVQARALREVEARKVHGELNSITVRDHPNARLSAIRLGDDITVRYTSRHHAGLRETLCRIVSIEEGSGTPDQLTLNLRPSGDFSYMPTSNPHPDQQPYLVEV